MIPNNSIDLQHSRRSSIELPSTEIVSSFFSNPNDSITIKKRLLNDFRCKIMADFLIQNPQIDQQIEKYFSAVDNFENIDQDFLKELLFNGYIATENLIRIFKEKNFEFNPIIISEFDGHCRSDNFFDLKIEDFGADFLFANSELDYFKTEQFKKSIEVGLEGLSRDRLDDSLYYQIMLIKLGDKALPMKLNGVAELLRNPNLIISPIEGTKINAKDNLNYYTKWNHLLRIINKEINKNKSQADMVISRISQDNSGSHNPNIEILNFSLDGDEKVKTSCCFGIVNYFNELFKSANKEPSQSPHVEDKNPRSLHKVDKSSILLG